MIENILNKINQQKDKTGLYIVATPIGNIFDISLRALYILQKADIIFAEDTRNSKKLLNFYEIDTPLIACHEYNEISAQVTDKIEPDKIYALISDAGTPAISDPGYRLVNWCIEHNINVYPIPGACSAIAGLSVAGLPTDRFTFLGFLPSKQSARKKALQESVDKTGTLVYFESPKRVLESLKDMLEIFGNRHCCICREITKLHEDFQRGSLQQVIEYFSRNEPLGEFAIIVAGNTETTAIDENAIHEELKHLLKFRSVKDSVAELQHKYNINKNDIYRKALELKNGMDKD